MAHCYLVFYNDDGNEEITVHRKKRRAVTYILKLVLRKLKSYLKLRDHLGFNRDDGTVDRELWDRAKKLCRQRRYKKLARFYCRLLETESIYLERFCLR